MKNQKLFGIALFITLALVPLLESQAQEFEFNRFHIRVQLPFTSAMFPQPGDNNCPAGINSFLAIGVKITPHIEIEASLPLPNPLLSMHTQGIAKWMFLTSSFQPYLYGGGGYVTGVVVESGPAWTGPTISGGLGFRWKITNHFSLIFQGGLTALFGTYQDDLHPSESPRKDTKFLPTADVVGLEFSF